MRRLVGGTAALVLVGAALLSSTGSAIAGEARIISLSMSALSAVSSGGVTKTDITFSNDSGHTLSNTHFLIGLDQVTLPSDVKVVAVFGGDSGVCPVVTDPVSTYDCNFGNIGAKPNQKTRSFSVAFSVGATGPHDISVEVKVSETGSDVGSNVNFQTATASVTASEGTCDTTTTYIPPGLAKTVLPETGTCATTDLQRSALGLPKSNTGNFVFINDANPATGCSSPLVCFGNQVSATVNDGGPVNPYLTWQIFYSNSVLGNINPKQVAFIHDGTVIPAGNKGLCKTATSVDCQDPYQVGTDGVTFFVRTASNGLIKGAH
jgi:hypothetical protein